MKYLITVCQQQRFKYLEISHCFMFLSQFQKSAQLFFNVPLVKSSEVNIFYLQIQSLNSFVISYFQYHISVSGLLSMIRNYKYNFANLPKFKPSIFTVRTQKCDRVNVHIRVSWQTSMFLAIRTVGKTLLKVYQRHSKTLNLYIKWCIKKRSRVKKSIMLKLVQIL